jgi:hypothetical protein
MVLRGPPRDSGRNCAGRGTTARADTRQARLKGEDIPVEARGSFRTEQRKERRGKGRRTLPAQLTVERTANGRRVTYPQQTALNGNL